MDSFWKVLGGVLIAAVLGLILMRQGKDISLLLAIGVSAMVALAAVAYIEPVIDFLKELQETGKLDSEMLGLMLKAVGIGLVTEIASLICQDAGNAAMAKTVQLLGTAVILWLALPMMRALLSMVAGIMGDV